MNEKEISGKIASLEQKEKNYVLKFEGSDLKYYGFGKIPENLSIGQDLAFSYAENEAGGYTYKNIKEIHPEGYEPEQAETGPTPSEAQEKKENPRTQEVIVRQNTLRTSVMILEVLHKINPEVANTFIGEAGGIEHAIRNLSRNLEKEVFREKESSNTGDSNNKY